MSDARAALANGEAREAIALFTEEIAQSLDDASLYTGRSKAWLIEGDGEKALIDANEAIALDPVENDDKAHALHARAQALVALERCQAAAAAFRRHGPAAGALRHRAPAQRCVFDARRWRRGQPEAAAGLSAGAGRPRAPWRELHAARGKSRAAQCS